MEGNNKYSVEEIIKIIKDKGFKNSELKVADEKSANHLLVLYA